jgi:myo-inositol-1(or 4)-monophosphatase
MVMELDKLSLSVEELSREVGAFILDEREKFSDDKVERKSLNSLVSYVDKEAEKMIVRKLEKLTPGCGFITEEDTIQDEKKALTWIVDPLDGTTNFIHGIPCFCVSIGLMVDDEVVLGVIYEANQDECFSAYKGGGAHLNGQKIRVKDNSDLNRSLLATGFPYYDFGRMEPYVELLMHFMEHTRGIRRLGSAAADLAYVAAGRFEAFYEYGLSPWDVAAGVIIVREAGGVVSDFQGGDNAIFGREILASNKGVYESCLASIQKFM